MRKWWRRAWFHFGHCGWVWNGTMKWTIYGQEKAGYYQCLCATQFTAFSPPATEQASK